jgi:hypothetical protein
VFTPASHHALVDRYVLNIFREGSNPAAAQPVAVIDLGHPAVVAGECTVDIRGRLAALVAGRYFATVWAIGIDGTFKSDPSPVFAR